MEKKFWWELFCHKHISGTQIRIQKEKADSEKNQVEQAKKLEAQSMKTPQNRDLLLKTQKVTEKEQPAKVERMNFQNNKLKFRNELFSKYYNATIPAEGDYIEIYMSVWLNSFYKLMPSMSRNRGFHQNTKVKHAPLLGYME